LLFSSRCVQTLCFSLFLPWVFLSFEFLFYRESNVLSFSPVPTSQPDMQLRVNHLPLGSRFLAVPPREVFFPLSPPPSKPTQSRLHDASFPIPRKKRKLFFFCNFLYASVACLIFTLPSISEPEEPVLFHSLSSIFHEFAGDPLPDPTLFWS